VEPSSDALDALEIGANWLAASSEAPGSAASAIPASDSDLVRGRVLFGLGYLPHGVRFGGGPASDAALAALLRDADANMAGTERWSPGSGPEASDWLFEFLVEALRFEGEPQEWLLDLPARGETTLASRIIQARLQILGAQERAAGRAWDADDEAALLSIGHWLRPPRLAGPQDGAAPVPLDRNKELRELVEITGSADEIVRRLLARDPSGFLICAAPRNQPPGYARLRGTLPDGRFAEAPDLATWLFGEGKPRQPPLFETAFDAAPNQQAQDNGNRLALRLLQVRLQGLGFYGRLIDGIFGDASWAALRDAMRGDDWADAGSAADEAFGECLRILPHGTWAALSLRLVWARLERFDAPAGAGTLADVLAEAPPSAVEANARRLVAAEAQFTRKSPARDEPDVGVFRPLRRVFRAAVTAIGRVFAAVGELVETMFQPLADLLAAFRRIADRLRHWLREATRPLRRFVFLRPVGDAQVLSRFSVDRDLLVFGSELATPQALAAHLEGIGADQQVLDRVGFVVGVAIRIGSRVASGPAGWLLLALGVLREVPDLLRRRPSRGLPWTAA
jgi:hypothetical protein